MIIDMHFLFQRVLNWICITMLSRILVGLHLIDNNFHLNYI